MVFIALPRLRLRLQRALWRLGALAAVSVTCHVAVAAADGDLPPVRIVDYPSPPYEHGEEVADETARLLRAGKIDGLEKLAARLRESRESFVSGEWLLSHFYRAASWVSSDQKEAEENVNWYRGWARKHPKSITAQICLARALITYAYDAYPTADHGKPTGGEWKLYNQRLAEAWEVLQRASKLEEKCPEWYATAQRLAFSQGWSSGAFLWLTAQAIQAEPAYGSYYENAMHWFVKTRDGWPGGLEKWMARQADLHPLADRDLEYARLVWLADGLRIDGLVRFGPGRVDWPRTQAGFDDWLKKTPHNLSVLSEYARLAASVGDRDTTRAALEKLGGNYLPGMWDENIANFQRVRKFAFFWGDNPFPFVEAKRSGLHLTPEALARLTLGLRLFSGMIGGLLAGALLLILSIQRGRIWAGVILLSACVVLAMPFGTATTLIPAVVLWLYLRRAGPALPPTRGSPSRWWVVLLWVLGLLGLDLGLQIGATALALIPKLFESGGYFVKTATEAIFSDGTALLICFNAVWIVALALLAICGRPTRDGWRDRLGLHRPAFLSSFLWTLLAVLFLAGMDYTIHPQLDARTQYAIKLIGLGIHSPGIFFLATVLAAPVVEELIFRGYAYSAWVHKFGVSGAISATTVLFTVSHVQYGWHGLLSVFLLGLTLGTLRCKTGSVYPGIAIHMLNNLVVGLGFYFVQGHG